MAKNSQFHTIFGTQTNIQLWPNTVYKHIIHSVPVHPNSTGSHQSWAKNWDSISNHS